MGRQFLTEEFNTDNRCRNAWTNCVGRDGILEACRKLEGDIRRGKRIWGDLFGITLVHLFQNVAKCFVLKHAKNINSFVLDFKSFKRPLMNAAFKDID